MTTYATFIERNEWEGETWRWYLPIEGNENAIDALVDFLTSDIDLLCPATFVVRTDPLDEATVDALVAQREVGYLYSHSKLSGRLTDVSTLPERSAEAWGELFYKGGIKDLVTQ